MVNGLFERRFDAVLTAWRDQHVNLHVEIKAVRDFRRTYTSKGIDDQFLISRIF
jgi:hypothetical protein